MLVDKNEDPNWALGERNSLFMKAFLACRAGFFLFLVTKFFPYEAGCVQWYPTRWNEILMVPGLIIM